jgi:isopenicillin N synthase-like dioxygenase
MGRETELNAQSTYENTRIIDIAPLHSSDDTKRAQVDQAIAQAMEQHGSFVATGFPGAAGFGMQMQRLLSFFTMDEDEKRVCAIKEYVSDHANLYRGFYPLPDKPHWSHNEIFDIGPEPPMTSPDVPGAESFREANVWPNREPVADWRREMHDVFVWQRDLSVVLMASIARGLGLEEEAVAGPARGRNGTYRILHYAPAPEGFELGGYPGREPETIEDGRKLLARTHVDTGILSLLWQDASGGLQMQGPDEVWREVEPLQDGLSVHGADLIKGLTEGILQGTTHRAVGDMGDRCSAGFFLEPDFETPVIAPTGGAPVSYARHLVNEFPDRFEAKNAA